MVDGEEEGKVGSRKELTVTALEVGRSHQLRKMERGFGGCLRMRAC
jgi:hypothetical protein